MSARALLLACCAVLAAWSAHASPTDNEYQACHRLAAKLLQHCLDEAPGRAQPQCFARARRANEACYADVRERHRRAREGGPRREGR